MFWKLIRWGGTIAIIAIIALAVVSNSKNSPASHQTQGEAGIKLN